MPKVFRNKEKSDEFVENIPGHNAPVLPSEILLKEPIRKGEITYDKLSITELSTIVADLGSITAGDITLGTAGYIKGGQTAYKTGTGFWLGYDATAYKLSIGSATKYMAFDGTDLEASNIVLVDTFTTQLAVTAGDALYILSDGTVSPASADLATTAKFIGFAMENVAASASVKVRLTGKATRLSGLTAGSDYYLQNATSTETKVIEQASKDSDAQGTNVYYQTFTADADRNLLTAVSLYIKNTGAGGGNCVVEIRRGTWDGALLGSKSIPCFDIPSAYGWTKFTFANPILVVPGETLVIKWTAADANGYWGYDNSDVYANGYFSKDTAPTTDIGDGCFRVHERVTDGNIGTSAGSVSKKVGIAVSATELLIQNS